MIRTLNALAEAMDVTRMTVHNWKKRGMPREPDGSYDPEKIIRWRATWDDQVVDDGAGTIEATETLRFWDTQFRKFRAKREELEFLQKQGELIPRTEAVGLLVSRATEFKRELLGRARRLAARLAHKNAKDISAILEKDSISILEKYSR